MFVRQHRMLLADEGLFHKVKDVPDYTQTDLSALSSRFPSIMLVFRFGTFGRQCRAWKKTSQKEFYFTGTAYPLRHLGLTGT
jgi:hypothetical protein